MNNLLKAMKAINRVKESSRKRRATYLNEWMMRESYEEHKIYLAKKWHL